MPGALIGRLQAPSRLPWCKLPRNVASRPDWAAVGRKFGVSGSGNQTGNTDDGCLCCLWPFWLSRESVVRVGTVVQVHLAFMIAPIMRSPDPANMAVSMR